MTDTPQFSPGFAMNKRELLSLIGKSAGAFAMLMAMAALNQAHASTFTKPIRLEGGANGKAVLVLGAGVAGKPGQQLYPVMQQATCEALCAPGWRRTCRPAPASRPGRGCCS